MEKIAARFLILGVALVLASCSAGKASGPPATPTNQELPVPTQTPAPTPTAAPQPATSTATQTYGTVSGSVCYPSSETPPMTIYLKNTITAEITSVDIERGQNSYAAELPRGEYIAYALTVGMNLRGIYACDSDDPCPFRVEPGQTSHIDLCSWYSPPGIRPPSAGQANGEVVVRLLQNMHARIGPHLSYPELGLLEAGTSLQALQLSADGEWVLVKHPQLELTGWLHAPLTRLLGNPAILPIDSEPPLFPLESIQFTPAIWRSDINRDIVHFKGAIRDEAGRPANGFSVFIDNGTWSVLSHPTGASHHYPDVVDGLWDVVIPNETDAAGWWTLTVVRYECPDFERGFNAQCKQYTPLSETKVVHVIHPDENVIEANWTCLEHCDQGLYVKPYRRPVDPIPGHWLLYAEDRALKSSPVSPVFDHEELKTIYDRLPDTFDGLQAYLSKNRPLRSPDGKLLIVNGPSDVTWLANLETGDLFEISRPAVPATWHPDSHKITYFKDNALFILDVETHVARSIWQQRGVDDPYLSWSNEITVKTDEATWYISPDGQRVRQAATEPELVSSIEDFVDLQEIPPITAWALSRDAQRVALNVTLGNPLKNAILIIDLETQTHTVVGPINGYRVPEIRWTVDDDLLLIGATNPKFPSGGAIFTMRPEADVLPEILLESDTAYLVDVLPEM